jgi:hypothetical protein
MFGAHDENVFDFKGTFTQSTSGDPPLAIMRAPDLPCEHYMYLKRMNYNRVLSFAWPAPRARSAIF